MMKLLIILIKQNFKITFLTMKKEVESWKKLMVEFLLSKTSNFNLCKNSSTCLAPTMSVIN